MLIRQRIKNLDSILKSRDITLLTKTGMTKDKMVGWHHRLSGHGFGWTPGVGDGQEGLVNCDSWARRVGHN